MGTDDTDPNELRIQVEVLREQKRHLEEQKQHLEDRLLSLGRELERTKSESTHQAYDLTRTRTSLEIAHHKLRHADHALQVYTNNARKKSIIAKFQRAGISIVFLVSSVLASLGTNMLTATPPNLLGWFMIALAFLVYLVAALLTITAGGED